MRIDVKQLKQLNFRKLRIPLLTLAALLVCAAVIYDLDRRNSELRQLTSQVEAMETQTAGFDLPTGTETRQWAAQEEALRNSLHGDESIPLLFAEITRIGSDHNIQGISINTEDHNIPTGVAAPEAPTTGEDADLLAVGVSRYSAVTIRFQGIYPDVAGFLDEISRLPYAVAVRSVELRRTIPLIDGTMLLHIYKRGAA